MMHCGGATDLWFREYACVTRNGPDHPDVRQNVRVAGITARRGAMRPDSSNEDRLPFASIVLQENCDPIITAAVTVQFTV
jgi:hypothetical protein